MDKNRVIGKDGAGLLWHLPADLKHFKSVTLGKSVIMGRKTFESIGKSLPERTNIVITRNTNYEAPGCVVVHSPDEALTAAGDAPEVMIIGGAEIFAQFLPRAKRMYVTLVDGVFSGNVSPPTFPNTMRSYRGDEGRSQISFAESNIAREGGWVYFLEWNSGEWREVLREAHGPDDKNAYGYTFLTLERG